MTRSFANWEADGGTMDRPAGGLRFDAVLGIPIKFDSEGLTPSGPSSLADLCMRCSMIDRCWSRTERLRCSCSRMTGSWVWKPGDRHARPTCCIEAVKGPPAGRTDKPLEDGRLVERSNFRGRGRLCIRGEDPGSFFTVTCGPPLAPCDLRIMSACEAPIS